MARKARDVSGPFITQLRLDRERVPDFDTFPFCLPVVRHMHKLKVHPKVTYFVGENGSGKSTLLEAIAVTAGFNAEGGSKNFNFATRSTESCLHEFLKVGRGAVRESNGFFLRAETFYNVASEVDDLRVSHFYGGSLHEKSHGESFLALVQNRFWPNSLYILDEPEAALSPARQLSVLLRIHELAETDNCQFIIATHSPLLMAYPEALMYSLSDTGIQETDWRETEHYKLTKSFLDKPEAYLHHLLKKP